jgi:hypothetical protein
LISHTSGSWQEFTGISDGPDYLTGYGLVDAVAARDHLVAGNVSGRLKPTGCPTAIDYSPIPLVSPVNVGGEGPVAGCPLMIWDVVWYVDVPAGTSELKVTIAWNDPAGPANSSSAIVNDLDLVARSPSGTFHYSWWLDPACPYRQAAPVSVAQWDPGVYADHHNTMEQIHLKGGVEPGTWKIVVNTRGVGSLSGEQPFALMISTQ